MEQKIVLDTDVCIEILKKNPDILSQIKKENGHFVTAVTQFELLLRVKNREQIHNYLNHLVVLPFDSACSNVAAEIARELFKKGKPIDFRDIFIAATSIVHKIPLWTLNTKHFKLISSLSLI